MSIFYWCRASKKICRPTYLQFWASYNEKYGTNYLEEHQNLSSYTGYSEMLYFPYKENWNNCSGYWLASPDSGNDAGVGCVDVKGNVSSGNYVDMSSYYGTGLGVRPLVELPDGIKTKKESDGLWTFTK